MPLSISIAFKLNFADSVSFKRGSTEIQLGQIKQEVKQGDFLLRELKERNRNLVEANSKLQQAARKRKIRLPELKEVEQAAKDTEEAAADLEENNEELQELVNDKPNREPTIK